MKVEGSKWDDQVCEVAVKNKQNKTKQKKYVISINKNEVGNN